MLEKPIKKNKSFYDFDDAINFVKNKYGVSGDLLDNFCDWLLDNFDVNNNTIFTFPQITKYNPDYANKILELINKEFGKNEEFCVLEQRNWL